MKLTDIINLAGGIALFLYGMSIMGSGLEKLAGGKMQKVLQRLTSNVPKAVLLGAVITGLIQSSAGTTVICIGLVNSEIISFTQAIGVIMGANIGTTITGQLIRLTDISGSGWIMTLIKPSTFSPIVAFAGAVLFVFARNPRKRNIGQICVGFGVLFTGLFTMEFAVAPLKESALFVELFTSLQNPILGVLVGALVTVALQSSSASVGVLQALSSTGAVTWGSAIPIILGQNIGTCSTPLLASVGASTAARRSAVVHLYFNLIGTAVFLAAIYGLKAAGLVPFWNQVMNRGDIADFHTLFNVAVTIGFMPFTKGLAWLAERTVPAHPCDGIDLTMPVLDSRLLQTPALALQQVKNAVEKMANLASANLMEVRGLFVKYDEEIARNVAQQEDLIDKMEVSIGDYLIQISNREITDSDNRVITQLLQFINEYERIGDYTINLMDCARQLHDRHLILSPVAVQQSQVLMEAVLDIQKLTNVATVTFNAAVAVQIEPLEETIKRLCVQLREEHIQRLKNSSCNIESGIIYLDMLMMMEHIANHCANIAAQLLTGNKSTDAHLRKHWLLSGADPGFNRYLEKFRSKYFMALQECGCIPEGR